MQAALLIQTDCILGEGPMWHAEQNSIWWVDIEDRKIFEFMLHSGQLHTRQLQKRVSFLTQIEEENNLLIALEDGIAKYNIVTGDLQYLLPLEDELPCNRSNDGGCDANGRLWLGTMHLDCKAEAGALYQLSNDLCLQKKIAHTTISNGMAWSLQNDRFYFIDSAVYTVDSYFFDKHSGEIQFEKTAIQIPKELGMPDGMAIDAEGMLWIAQWGGFCIYRWNPVTGNMIDKINVPAPHVTSCTFGGENLDYIFITTARQSLDQEEIKKYPLSGSVFVAKPQVKGVAKNRFKLVIQSGNKS